MIKRLNIKQYVQRIFKNVKVKAEAYLEPAGTSTMEVFCENC